MGCLGSGGGRRAPTGGRRGSVWPHHQHGVVSRRPSLIPPYPYAPAPSPTTSPAAPSPPTPAPPSATIDKESFVTETLLAPPSPTIDKPPEVDLALVSKRGLAPLGAGTAAMIRAQHRRRGTSFVWTPPGPSAPPWPHQGDRVFARPAPTPSPPPWPHQGASLHSGVFAGPAPTPSPPPWPHQAASRHGRVFARPAPTPSPPPWPHQAASRHGGVFAPSASPPPWRHQDAYQHGVVLRQPSPSPPAAAAATSTMVPLSATIDKELEAAAADKAPKVEVDLAPVSSKGLALPARLGAGTITMIRLNHRRREGGRGGGRAPTGFVWTPQGPSAPPWPHQGASRHGSVFAGPARTPCLYAPSPAPSPATASSQVGHPTAEKAQVSKKGRAHAARPGARTVRKVMIRAKRFLFDGAGNKLFHYEVVSSMEWPHITKHRGLASNSRQPVRDVISSSSSNRMMMGTSKIQVIVQMDNFGSLPLPFQDGCTIQEIVSAAFRKQKICILDAVMRFNGRNAYLEDTVCSLNTGNNEVCTLYIRPRLRGGQPPSPSSSISPVRELFALYLSSLGDELFDVVTLPPDPALCFIGIEKYFVSLGFTAIQIAIMLFELLENFHEHSDCVSRFTLADLDYDSSSKRLMFRDTVGLVSFDVPTYYQNMSDAGDIVSAIFQFDELKVLACRRGIYLPPGTVGNNHSRLPKLVQFLVYDLQTGVTGFPGAGTNKRKRAYFRCHVAVMTPAERLAFWMTSEMHFDYLGGERELDYYLAVPSVPDWSTKATRSTAMRKVFHWRTYDTGSLGHQWSISRNWLAHAKVKLTHKISEKQAEAYLQMIFECLMYYVLLRISFDTLVINWNTRPIPAAQPPPPRPYFRTRRVGPPLRVNNQFTLHQLVDMSGSL